MELNEKKLKALVHYVAYLAHDPSVLGKTKLNKVLWISDLNYYLLYGEPITGEEYIKHMFGPVPKHIDDAIEELDESDSIVVRDCNHYGYSKKEYIALNKPDISIFSAEEISIIHEAFDHVCHNNTAVSISEETHDEIWETAGIGEDLPLFTAFAAMPSEIDDDDIRWISESLQELSV